MRFSILFLTISMVFSVSAMAQDNPDFIPDRMTVSLGSKHFASKYELNEVNPGVFLSWNVSKDKRWKVTGGVYKNSYGKPSAAAFGSYSIYRNRKHDVEVSVFGGVAYYPEDGRYQIPGWKHDIIPMGGLEVRYKNIAVQAYPVFSDNVKGMVSIGITIPLN